MEEQYYVMKPGEVIMRSFDLLSTTDRAEIYQCTAILKASDFSEVDRVECQISTTATVFNNGTQIGSTNEHKKKGGIWAFLDAINVSWHNLWDFVINFLTGKSCSWTKCASLLDFTCHFQYICIGWLVLITMILGMIPLGLLTLWLLHQKGFFDPMYDWWDDLWGLEPHYSRAHRKHKKHHHHHHHHHHRHSHHSHRHHHARRSEPDHHHHAVLHRHGEHQLEVTVEGGHCGRHGHDMALDVQHRGGAGQKHRHGKAVAAVWDEPRWQHGAEDVVAFRDREWRQDEARHAQHGLHDAERRHSRF